MSGTLTGRRSSLAIAVAAIGLQVSCAASQPRSGTELAGLFGAGSGYTLANLHPDEARRKLYAVNYQQAGLIPLCSQVEFLQWEGDRMTFRVVSTGREYVYDYHKAAVVSFEDHLALYFGRSCDRTGVESLSKLDRSGIAAGRVSVGMTKRGTILAIGYPPPHQTPALDAKVWKYWRSRFDTLLVSFGADDRVSGIRD